MAPRVPLFSRRGLPWLGVALWTLGLSILAGMWIYLLSSLEADRERAIAAARTEVAGLTQAFAEHARGSLQQIDQLARFLVHDFEQHGARADLSVLAREGLFNHAAITGVFMADARGEVFASTRGMFGAAVAQEDYFKVQRLGAGQPLYIGRPMPAGSGDHRVMHFTRRLAAADGSFAGVVAVVVDPAFFTRFCNEAQFGKQGLVNLVGLDGVVRARRSGSRLWFGDTITDNYPPPQAAQNLSAQQGPQGGFSILNKLDGVQRFMHYQVLRDYSMIAVTGLAEDEVLAPYAELRSQRLGFFALASVLLLLAFAGLGVLAHRLRMSEARFVAAADSQLDAFFILRAQRDAQGKIVDFRCEHCNDRASELFGVAKRTLLERSRGEIFGDAANAQRFEMYRRVVETGRPMQEEFLITRPPAEELWLQYQATPFGNGLVLTARDVTAAHQREQALVEAQRAQRESEQRLRMVADNIPGYVVHVDDQQRIVYANRPYELTALAEPGSPLGKTVREARGAGVYESLRPHIDAVLAGEPQRFTLRQEEDGKVFYYQYHYVPDVTEDGRVRGFYALAYDVTETNEARLEVEQQERRLRSIANHLPALIGQFDREERCLFANDRALQLHGVARDDLAQHTLRSALGEDLYAQHAPYVQQALQGQAVRFDGKAPHQGGTAYYQAHLVPDWSEGEAEPRGFYLMSFDVTALKQAELRQLHSERRLRGIADNLPVLIAHLDRDERLEFANETARDWFGQAPETIAGHRIAEVWGPVLDAERRPYLERAYAGERVDFQAEREAQGVTRFLLNSYIPEIGPDGHVRGVYMLSTDVSALKAVEQQLSNLARFDALTGLANRHQFNERLPEALKRSQRTGQAMALMYLDIDHFKAINDNFGHATGDEVLREFAVRLKQGVRTTDTVARLAGDEFVVILENVHSDAEPQFVARKIVAQVNRPFLVAGLELHVSTSVGISVRLDGTISPDELLARADKALYAAKSAGRNTFHVAASS